MRNRARPLLAALALTGSIIAVVAVARPAAGDPTPAGAFAIGDVSAVLNPTVTFWGSQWRKDNQLSTGTAPASFKGYAVNVDSTTCTFTSTTGNSAPPPSGPLPQEITVLVTSEVTQSGSTISGKISGFALVKTNDGYDSNPGHAGTGTVLGFDQCVIGPGGN
jgi:hypothetical protein